MQARVRIFRQNTSNKLKICVTHFLVVWKLLPNASQWVLHTVWVQDSVQVSSASVQWGISLFGGPEQALVMEQEVDTLLRKDATEVVPPCDRIRVLEEVPKKDGGIASYSRSEIIEPLSHETQVQDDYDQASRVPNQVRGLVCDDRSERHLLPYIHSYSTPEVPKVCFQGQSIPISGSFVRPSTLTPHFHKVCGCSSGFVSSLEHPHTELHRRLVDSSSIRAVSSLASR